MILDVVFLLSLGTAVSYTVMDIWTRKGLFHVNAFVGSTINLLVQVVIFFFLGLFAGFDFPPVGLHYVWIVLGGVAQPGLFLIFYLIGIKRIGISRAVTVKGSAPIIGAALAVMFFGEKALWIHLVGVVLVVAGVTAVTLEKTAVGWRRADLIWPFLAACMIGLSANFWRRGLSYFSNPLDALLIVILVSTVMVGVCTWYFLRGEDGGDYRRALGPFIASGLASGLANLFLVNALARGEVFRVLPIVQLSPLITVLYAILFLRQTEKMDWRIPVGAVLTVAGAVLVSLKLGEM